MGKRRVNLGITTYDFKAALGAELDPVAVPAVADYVWDEVLLGYRLRTLSQIVPDERSARQSSDSR